MGWFDFIKGRATKKDDSPSLKKGEIKEILVLAAKEFIPSFNFLDYRNSCYTFSRVRNVDGHSAHEIIGIRFSLKERCFSCSIASRLNPEYIHNNAYNIGFINPHVDLKVLRFDSGVLNIRDAYYFFDGSVLSAEKAAREIFKDYVRYGIPFLDTQAEKIQSNILIKTGFEYIANLETDRESLRSELTSELNKCGLLLSCLQHPVYLELKEKLQNTSHQNMKDRQSIPGASLEFLEIYWRQH